MQAAGAKRRKTFVYLSWLVRVLIVIEWKKMAIDISANLKARKSVFTHITSGYVIKRLQKKTGQPP